MPWSQNGTPTGGPTANADSFSGTSGNDSPAGAMGGDDVMLGLDGNDVLQGDAGNDSLAGGRGSDRLFGGDGDDVLFGATPGSGSISDVNPDTMDGGAGDDVIVASSGGDSILGGSGNDSVTAGEGNDTVSGDAGNDTLLGGLDNDLLLGGDDDDRLQGGAGSDTLDGGNGHDVADYSTATAAITVVMGVNGDGDVTGGADVGTDTLIAMEGVIGGRGADLMTGPGDSGHVMFDGAFGNDTLVGGAGNDTLFGGARDDRLFGGDGDDRLQGGVDSDTLNGGSGIDVADYGNATARIWVTIDLNGDGSAVGGADVGTDSLFAIENVTTGSGDDRIISTGATAQNLFDGGAGNDSLDGGGGDDTLVGGAGNDTLIGGAGNDWASYAGATGGVTVALNLVGNGTASGGSGVDSLRGVENLEGGDFADSLAGGASDNTIAGGAGDDTISGGAGNDSLMGGSGTNTLDYSGSPSPVLLDLGADTVNDGQGGTDTISGFGNYVLGNGNDTVVAVGGADTIHLGGGNDSYAWSSGGGNDTLYLDGGSDTLDLQGWNPGNNPWTVTPGATPSDPTIISNGTDTITVYGYTPGDDTITCFAEGTRIATVRGEVAVEDLRAGDLVVAAHGGAPLQPLVWVGHTHVNVARQRDRSKAAPVLIKAGALAKGVPFRDLRVSPEHAIFLDGRLVPARLLVNGSSIVQELWVREVTYYHVELERHGLVVSEGAVTETYLDDGNRHLFDNAKVTALVVDFEAKRGNGTYVAQACAPLVHEGSMALERIRARIADLAGQAPRRREVG